MLEITESDKRGYTRNKDFVTSRLMILVTYQKYKKIWKVFKAINRMNANMQMRVHGKKQ